MKWTTIQETNLDEESYIKLAVGENLLACNETPESDTVSFSFDCLEGIPIDKRTTFLEVCANYNIRTYRDLKQFNAKVLDKLHRVTNIFMDYRVTDQDIFHGEEQEKTDSEIQESTDRVITRKSTRIACADSTNKISSSTPNDNEDRDTRQMPEPDDTSNYSFDDDIADPDFLPAQQQQQQVLLNPVLDDVPDEGVENKSFDQQSDEEVHEHVTVATAEPEVFSDPLTKAHLNLFFQRAMKCPVNNNTNDIIYCRTGEVYLFNKEDGDNPRKHRRLLGECDGFVWRNCGTTDKGDIHLIHSVASKDDEVTKFRRTIYWHTNQPFAIIHYRGVFSGSTPKQAAKGRSRTSVKMFNMKEQNKNDYDSKRRLFATESNVTEQTFAPSSVITAEELLRIRAEIRPVKGQMQYHIAQPFNASSKVGTRMQRNAIEHVLGKTKDTHFLDCNLNAIYKPENAQLYIFHVPKEMQMHWEQHILRDGYRWKKRSVKESNEDTFTTYRYFLIIEK